MKLVQATCECGFRTRKARFGYHFHKWWFPVFHIANGNLTDVVHSLPDEQVGLIQRSEVKAETFHKPFVTAVTEDLRAQFAKIADFVFNPTIPSNFACPTCRNYSLCLENVYVKAFCRTDCGHEYQWHDSEQFGCPKCTHRPHSFQVDFEPTLFKQNRTLSFCSCSSRLDSNSHVDAFCPKCGQLPESYENEEGLFCGIHHFRLLPYQVPKDFLFIETWSRWEAHRFPNAKHWGDADSKDSVDSSYCKACEADHQHWLANETE